GYGGGYDAVRRYARRWSKERGQSTAAAYVPLSFAPGEAFQFDSHGLLEVKVFRRHIAEPLGYWS
ncbi:MAG: IS21 family transposase, partial [Rhodoplanes sp.]